MKPLDQLNNVERAKLLHELMPGTIQDFLDYAKGLVTYIRTHQAELAESWGEQFFSFDAWLRLAQDAEKRIDRYGAQLVKSSRLFADQLFDGYTALWSGDTWVKYVSQTGYSNAKFAGLVKAFFTYQPEHTAGNAGFVKRYNELSIDAATYIWQRVAGAKKLSLDRLLEAEGVQRNKDFYERLPFFTYFNRPGRHESVAITELEAADGKDVVIKGIFTGDSYPNPVAIVLDELDNASSLYLADYLLHKAAS
jgi:hypothetical protein